MSQQEEQLKRIYEKLQGLVKQHQFLLQENDQLKKALGQSHEKNGLYKTRVEMLEERVAILKTATGQLDDADKKDLEKRLNHYLKEIDRCITMLSE